MKKNELIDQISENTGIAKASVKAVLESMLEEITLCLARGDKVQLTGFGVFGTRSRAGRTGRNPRTGEPMEIAAAVIPVFKAGKELRARVQKS